MSNENSARPPLFKREVSVGDIVSLSVAIAAIFVAYGKLDTRVTVVEAAQVYQVKSADTFQNDIKITLREINEKIGALADRMPRR